MNSTQLDNILAASEKFKKEHAPNWNLPKKDTLDIIKEQSKKLANPLNTFGKDPSLITLDDKAIELLDEFLQQIPFYDDDMLSVALERINYNPKIEPTTQALKILVINELMLLAEHFSWRITYTNLDIYVYNKEFWIKISDQNMLRFLRDVAIEMGGAKYEVGNVKFVENMYKQLLLDGFPLKNIKAKNELFLNLQNGTLVIDRYGAELRGFDYEDFLTYQLLFKYNPNSINQSWLNFLEEVQPEEDTRKTLQQALGALLLRSFKIEQMILLFGSGANGKSVIFEVLHGLLGEDSFSNYSLNSLTDSKGYHRSNLKDKLINFASDIDLSKVDAGMMKTLASGEPVECRLPYKEPFIMRNYAKMIFSLNKIDDAKIENTKGFFRRFLFVPFYVEIPEEKQDKTLHEKLLNGQDNKAGILNWLLDGAKEVIKNKGSIFESQESKDVHLKFKNLRTTVEIFVSEMGVQHDTNHEMTTKELHDEYIKMCNDKGIKDDHKIKSFSNALKNIGFNRRDASRGTVWDVKLNPKKIK